MARIITDEMRDAMIAQVIGFKKSQVDAARLLDVSSSSVNLIVRVFTAVSSQDWDLLKKLILNSNAGLPTVMWAQNRIGVSVPKEILDLWQSSITDIREKRITLDPEPDPVPQPATAPEPAPQDVNALVLCEKLIKAQDAILATLGDILDGLKVLASDIKDNNNVNTDLICQKLNQTTELLNGIKANTRKKGL